MTWRSATRACSQTCWWRIRRFDAIGSPSSPTITIGSDASVRAFAARPEVELLDVHAHPLEVVRGIASSRFVLSSSLHGLVVADAFGVPACWVAPTTKVEGAGYKFRDYYSVFDMEPPRTTLADWPTEPWSRVEEHEAAWARPGIDDVRAGLVDALRQSGV